MYKMPGGCQAQGTQAVKQDVKCMLHILRLMLTAGGGVAEHQQLSMACLVTAGQLPASSRLVCEPVSPSTSTGCGR